METVALLGDPTMGQGGKVTASKASKSSSGCKEAWRAISTFPFC